ncbi:MULTISPECIES: PxKF domain-containing protein [unclassified Arthrobacter]|uniref:PxKF domain-containing protein n=1 Tax=unclassified Arthrobacter TaxID=235627 RepID=UPI0028834E20|nr:MULTISPECIES: PxKF domain-containing protein [unclassified Arthrobacter]
MAATALLAGGMVAFAPPSSAVDVPVAPGVEFSGFTDKSALQNKGRAIVAGKQLSVTDGSAPAGSGATYFVDSAGGDDSAAGTSTGTAWKTFGNVNAKEFGPGDRILLKAGSSWSAEGTQVAMEAYDYTQWIGGAATDVSGPGPTFLLAPKGSGTSTSPIVLSSYGDGAAPELNGRGVVNDVLQLTNQQHWYISNLEISNMTDGFDPSRFQPQANNGQVPGEENPQTGDLRGIHVSGENAGTLRGYDISNVFVRDVSGVTWSVSGSGLDRSKRSGGILFEGLKGYGQTPTQFEGISVRGNFIANTAFANLTFKQFAGMGTNRYQNLPPGWGDRAAGRAAPDGSLTEDPDWRPHTDIDISGNYMTNRDTQYGWNSMYLTSVKGATVEENMIDGAGVSGIEMYYSDNILVQNNEVAELEVRQGAADSNGIDPDRGTSNILIQGNYVHDSGEGILLCGFSFSTAVVRYNIIQDIDRNYINPHGDSGVNVIYNNLMYNTRVPLKNNTVGFFESSGSASTYLVEKNPHYVLNNVFLNTREDVSGGAFRAGFPGVHFDNNAYHGPKLSAPIEDNSAITTDPKLGGNPAESIGNAALTSGDSPLISAGTPVNLATIAPGFQATGNSSQSQNSLSVDFFSQNVTTPPNVGPTSYKVPAGYGLVSGIVSDADGEAVSDATVSYGSGTVTTDLRGRYAIQTATGEYTMVPSATGYADGAPVTVTLIDGETLTAPLTLGATTATEGALTGTVSAARVGLSGVAVTVSKGDQAIATATTDAAGVYKFPALAMGDGYTVSAVKKGYEPISQSDVVIKAARTAVMDLVLTSLPGETRYVINETFDDEITGAFTQTSDGVLTAETAPAVGSINVLEDSARTGNKYLEIAKTSSSTGSLAVHNTAEQNLTGTVTLEARVQRTSTNGTPNQLAMYSYTESSWNATNPPASANPSATFGFANGKVITHNVTGSGSVKNVTDYKVGQWYTVRNVVNLDTGTFDFYVDDMTTPVLTDQPLRTKVDDLDYLSFFINGSNVGNMLVDYFRVNTGTPYEYNDASLRSVGATTADGDVSLTASADGLTYSGTVDPYTKAVAVTAAPGSQFGKVTINGTDATNGAPVEVALTDGSQDDSVFVTDVPVVVTAEDGNKRAYNVSISRTNPNQSTELRNVAVDGYELSPAFESGRQGADVPYTVTQELDSSVPSVNISWQAGWAGQQIQVNGKEMAEGATGTTVDLKDGENVVEVTSSSYPGDFGTYVIKLTRKSAAVPWELKGFSSPVDMGGVWNTVKGGSTVPFKFEMFDRGVELTDPAMVRSFAVTSVRCPGSGSPTAEVEFVTTGGTQLSYVDGQFLQKWKTPKGAGSCLTVTMTAADGSRLSAYFITK